jgi:hypothetical protein
MIEKEFCLADKIVKDSEGIKVLILDDIEEFIEILKEASENNDWEVAVDDGAGAEDGFRVISGVEFINNLLGLKLSGGKE